MMRMTIRERRFARRAVLFALAWPLFVAVAAAVVHAAPVRYAVEEGCYARQEDALAAFDRLGRNVSGDLAASLRVERLDSWYCLRLGAERNEAAIRGLLRDNRQALPGAVVVEAKALPGRVVAGMAPGMARPLIPPAGIAAGPLGGPEKTAPMPTSGPGDVAAGPASLPDRGEGVELPQAAAAAPSAAESGDVPAGAVPAAAKAPEQTADASVPGPASPLVPRGGDLPAVPAALEMPAARPQLVLAALETPADNVPAVPAALQDSAPASPPATGQGATGGRDAARDVAGDGRAGPDTETVWLAVKVAALILVLVLGVVVWRRRRGAQVAGSATAGKPGGEGFVEPGRTPRLSEADEQRLQENLDELAMVQSNILSSQNGQAIRSIYVTSCANEEGKTTAAINMAHGLSINKNRVLLVDGNPRAPALHKRYHTDVSPGLSSWLAGNGESREGLVRPTFYPNLSLITFGAAAPGRPNLLAENALSRFLGEYAGDFDYIIMDGHSMTGSDTGMVASIFDAVVIVAQCEKTKWEVVKHAAQKMTLMGGKVLGVVLNRRKYYVPDFIYKAL